MKFVFGADKTKPMVWVERDGYERGGKAKSGVEIIGSSRPTSQRLESIN